MAAGFSRKNTSKEFNKYYILKHGTYVLQNAITDSAYQDEIRPDFSDVTSTINNRLVFWYIPFWLTRAICRALHGYK